MEVRRALEGKKNLKAPGPDGFRIDFLRYVHNENVAAVQAIAKFLNIILAHHSNHHCNNEGARLGPSWRAYSRSLACSQGFLDLCAFRSFVFFIYYSCQIARNSVYSI